MSELYRFPVTIVIIKVPTSSLQPVSVADADDGQGHGGEGGEQAEHSEGVPGLQLVLVIGVAHLSGVVGGHTLRFELDKGPHGPGRHSARQGRVRSGALNRLYPPQAGLL